MILRYDRMCLSEGKRHPKVAHPGFKVLPRYDSETSSRLSGGQNATTRLNFSSLFFLISWTKSPLISAIKTTGRPRQLTRVMNV